MLRGQTQLGAIYASLLFAIVAYTLALPQTARGVEIESLYTVEVPFDRQDPDARSNAYKRAVGEVLVRVTGVENAAEAEEFLALFPNPGRYVLQFRPGENDSLVVSLDGPAMERVLRQAGKPVWGSDRPLTLVWLAVDWGGGDREIVAADATLAATQSIDRNRQLRERVQAVAKRRGIPVLFPLVDTQDLESLSFSDIWGGFDDAVLEASRRYGARSVLVGRIRAEEAFRDRWTYYFGDQERQWSGNPEMSVNELADLIASQFAYRGDAPVETVDLTISGIDSIFAYGAVQRFLKNLSVIDSYRIDRADGDEILFRIQVQGGRDRLAAALEFSGILERDNWLDATGFYETTSNAPSLDFVYRPYTPDASTGSINLPDIEGGSR
ncbi:MAG: DUF2066 domain-containing protein [Gammaproteobacteria bacterium]|nr:DUF2066 domain-containing protein [Gammaproteobacteria bacterium]